VSVGSAERSHAQCVAVELTLRTADGSRVALLIGMTLSTRCTLFALAICALLVPLAAAQDAPLPADKTLSPYFFVDGGDPAVDRLPLKETRVDVAITGVIADVTVRQVYENRGTRPIHARYIFPASTRAAVYGMTMTVGDVRIVAKIKEREQAKTDFEAAKREGKSASLLEQSRPNVFTMNIANVLPGDIISVELKYTELLVPTDGTYEFVYPTVVGPRYSQKSEGQASPEDAFVKTPYTREGIAPTSDFHIGGLVSTGIPIQDIASPSHHVVFSPTAQGRTEVALADVERFSGNRDFILRYRLAGETISSGLLLYQGRDENFFLLMAEPPHAVTADEIPSREYIYVVDVSGSMNGFPLDTAKKLMRDLASVLRPSDTFNVIVFADGSETFSRASVPATAPNLARALQFIGRKSGNGGTELLSALQRAVALPRQPAVSRSIVLLTDGYIEAEASVFDYVRNQLDDANFFAFGIGSSVNRFLIEGVARAGLGEPFIVTEPGEALEAATKLRHYIDSPVLTDINLTFSGFDVYDVEPRKVPDLFASRPIVVFGKWRGAAGGSIEISGKTGRGLYQTSIAVSPIRSHVSHAALRHLWARTRIANLADFGPHAPAEDRIAEITSLGLTYGLLTKYTSFIAVHEIVRRTTEGADDVDQPLPLPAGVSNRAVGVTSGAEPELVWIAALVLAFFSAARLLLVRRSLGEGGRMKRSRSGVVA
jgi:Ca-activated chloride channel family protein